MKKATRIILLVVILILSSCTTVQEPRIMTLKSTTTLNSQNGQSSEHR